jgi:hypothetical protein
LYKYNSEAIISVDIATVEKDENCFTTVKTFHPTARKVHGSEDYIKIDNK